MTKKTTAPKASKTKTTKAMNEQNDDQKDFIINFIKHLQRVSPDAPLRLLTEEFISDQLEAFPEAHKAHVEKVAKEASEYEQAIRDRDAADAQALKELQEENEKKLREERALRDAAIALGQTNG